MNRAFPIRRSHLLRRPSAIALTGAVALGAATSAARAATVDLPRYPALSPDGREVVFTWRGDIWKAPAQGGSAVRLTSHPADDLRSEWSPDGSLIAFESERDGYRNLYLMRPDGSGLRQVTSFDVPVALSDFGVAPDGTPALYFDAAIEGDLYRSPRPYRIGLNGGQPVRTLDAFGTAAQASADGREILFERGGSSWSRRGYRGPDARDVWLYEVADAGQPGSFRRLTEWEGNDGLPCWIGAEDFLFLSDRENGAVNLYRRSTRPGSTPVRLTDFTEVDVHSVTASADGKRAIVGAWDTLYAVDLTAGKPNAKALTFVGTDDGQDGIVRKAIGKTVSEAALSPDGKTLAVVAYGDVWVRGVEDKSPPRRLTDGTGRERDIAWSPDGLTLYFVSDRENGDSIYAAKVEHTREELRARTEERLRPKPPADTAAESGDAAAEATKPSEPDDKADGADGEAGKSDEPANEKEEEKTDGKDDAKKDAKDKKKKRDPALDPERWADAVTFTIAPVIEEASYDRDPRPSPDGTKLVFRRGLGTLMLTDLDPYDGTKTVGAARELARGFDEGVDARWSPDSSLIAYSMDDLNFNSDIWLVPADGSAPPVNITRHPDSDGSPRWSADGKILAFTSERVNEEYDVWFVFLDRDLEGLTGRDLDEYYKKAAEAAKKRKPLEAKARPAEGESPKPESDADANADANAKTGDAEGSKPDATADEKKPFGELEPLEAYLRLRRVTTLPGNEGDLEILPSGEKLIFSGREGTANSLYSIKNDGTGMQKVGPNGNVQGLNFAGDKVLMVVGGAPQTIGVGGGDAKTYDLNESIDVDLAQLSSTKFLEAARVIGEQFYHPTMKGLDWPALTARYHDLARRARTSDEFDWIANRLMGELNASHLGVRAPQDPSALRQPKGRLGTRVRPVEGGFEVVSVLPESPATLAKEPLQVGDVITAIDFEPFSEGETVESKLAGKVGKEVVVTVRRAVPSAPEPLVLDLLVVPADFGAERALAYQAITRDNARLVDELSGGTIGYIHIQGMDQRSLDEFERDLYASAADKKGLIIDVRNNGGGWTADRLLSSIMVQRHAYTVPRGGDLDTKSYPQDRLFIQRYTLPIDMLCNEKSFSNAEIISHAFKTLKRGTLVGQQTYGGVISTGGTTLLDGTFVRLPFRGWFLPDGVDMENHGAVPDILVQQTPEDEATGTDAQLRAAVRDLMSRVE